MQAECLRSQIAPLAARYRSCSSNRQRTSAAQCLGSQFAPLAARYRSCSSNRQRTSAAQCLGSQFAPWQLAIARAHQTASARPRPSAWALNSPPGSSLSLVLIEPPAHVRGGCTPGNSRQRTAAKRRACAKEKRTCAPGAERSERKSFLMKLFYKKVFDLALDLTRRAAQERKLGKQRSVFPGR